MELDTTPNLTNHLQKEIEKIQNDAQVALEEHLLAIWEMSGDDTLMQALTRNGYLDSIQKILKAIGIDFSDLEVETPSHLQGADEQGGGDYAMDCARDNEITDMPGFEGTMDALDSLSIRG